MRNKHLGFTLIELLVVIAIIGVLAAVVLVSLSSARAKSRDARRISDAHQVQTALELFFNDTGGYPDAITPGTSTIACGTSTYMNPVPKDPSTNTYAYSRSGTSSTTTKCTGSITIWPNYSWTFTTEQPSALGTAGAHTADNNGLR